MTDDWKKERPTSPGYYWTWACDDDHKEPCVIWIYELHTLKGIQLTTSVSGAPNLNGCYWNDYWFLGPISCPAEKMPKPSEYKYGLAFWIQNNMEIPNPPEDKYGLTFWIQNHTEIE